MDQSPRKPEDAARSLAKPGWSLGRRTFVSVLLIVWLLIVVIGPLSNPIGSDHLTRPLGRWVAPIHQATFTGHGYRFFGPDPAPGHIVAYTITHSDGRTTEGQFPDADAGLPRLMYHRWFMLSETIASEHALTPAADAFEQQQRAMLGRSREMKLAGQHEEASQILQRRTELADRYAKTRERIDALVRAVARQLLMQTDGDSIELFVQERLIPFPTDVLAGAKLDDPEFLSPQPPPSIGKFTRNELLGDVSDDAPAELPVRARDDAEDPQ